MDYIEQDCTLTHNGRDFTAGGAVITDNYVIGYPKGNVLNDWHGNPIGSCQITSTWRTRYRYMSSTMSSYEVFVAGRRYVGRGCGDGMILRAKHSPKPKR